MLCSVRNHHHECVCVHLGAGEQIRGPKKEGELLANRGVVNSHPLFLLLQPLILPYFSLTTLNCIFLIGWTNERVGAGLVWLTIYKQIGCGTFFSGKFFCTYVNVVWLYEWVLGLKRFIKKMNFRKINMSFCTEVFWK